MEEVIRNKVAESGIITLNLEDFYPKEEIVIFDIKDYLFMEMILKEKDFREALKQHDWQQYTGKNVGITCTADAIVPLWAYMLITTYLQPIANYVAAGDVDELKKRILLKNINAININEYIDKRVVIKGCGDISIGEFAYAEITRVLLPVVKSLMYGEPCSTVPVYKKDKQESTGSHRLTQKFHFPYTSVFSVRNINQRCN
ncbi:DUF2480 family protein [Niabella ginsengisoli]|uniref:DUF2480 family protein n=1 Tax=Niabella ginsengisoli TaxID=522298 RepID=A0ABS9SNM4_9BACT|nr:DUF2480 family protein [Niabella ginsengisoli]MCH5599983.1 DUF2480 family protein [Niabella ginsengisoli]